MTIIGSIVEIYKNNNNPWLDYNEIYEKLDKNLFGKNKHGERGQKNIVYRLLLSYDKLFVIDESYRPKKFRLKSHDGLIDDTMSKQIKYSTGESRIFFNNVEYNIIEHGGEREFEQEVINNYKLIFGENSIYFDLKKKLGSNICDGFVYDQDEKRLIIVETEIVIHDLWRHIIPQIIGFFNAIKKEEVRMKLKYEIDWGINDNLKLELIESIDKSDFDIVVVIDKISFEIMDKMESINELVKIFSNNKNMNVFFKELKVYINENNEKIYEVN